MVPWLVIAGDGEVYSWGRGPFGRLGTGREDDELVPTAVAPAVGGRGPGSWPSPPGPTTALRWTVRALFSAYPDIVAVRQEMAGVCCESSDGS